MNKENAVRLIQGFGIVLQGFGIVLHRFKCPLNKGDVCMVNMGFNSGLLELSA